MTLIDMLTRQKITLVPPLSPTNGGMAPPIAPLASCMGITFEDEHAPFNPVISTTAQQEAQGTLNGFAVDFMLVLKKAGCDPFEAFAVCSILESLVRDHSKIVDTSPEECDMVWKDEIR